MVSDRSVFILANELFLLTGSPVLLRRGSGRAAWWGLSACQGQPTTTDIYYLKTVA